MPIINNINQLGPITNGRDFNFYQKLAITSPTFGTPPNMVITFSTKTVMMYNEDATNVIEFSLNGNTVHGELDPTKLTQALTFDDRVMSYIWFRVKAGSSGSPTINVMAWGN